MRERGRVAPIAIMRDQVTRFATEKHAVSGLHVVDCAGVVGVPVVIAKGTPAKGASLALSPPCVFLGGLGEVLPPDDRRGRLSGIGFSGGLGLPGNRDGVFHFGGFPLLREVAGRDDHDSPDLGTGLKPFLGLPFHLSGVPERRQARKASVVCRQLVYRRVEAPCKGGYRQNRPGRGSVAPCLPIQTNPNYRAA